MQGVSKKRAAAAIAATAMCAATAFAQKTMDMEARSRGVFVDAPAPLGTLAGGSSTNAAAKKRGGFQPASAESLRFAKLEALPVSRESGPLDMRRWTLSALVDKGTGSIDYYLHYYEIYGASGWKSLSVAQTDASEGLKVGRLNARMVSCLNGCSFSEELFIDLTPGVVERARTQPLRIQLSGPGAAPALIELDPQAVNDLVARAGVESAKYRRVSAPAAAMPAPAAVAVPPGQALVADELQKLSKLRADGTITEQEFQGLKAKLLAR
jgi:hypothetical protein